MDIHTIIRDQNRRHLVYVTTPYALDAKVQLDIADSVHDAYICITKPNINNTY